MRQQDFHQHSSTLCPSARQSVNSPFVHTTFHQLPSTFCLSVENILCGSWTFCLTSDNFLCGCVTFRQLSVHLRYHPSSSSASTGYSVNFSSVRRTFRQLRPNFHGSTGTSVNIFCIRGTFRQHQLTFRASAGLTINWGQFIVRLRDLLPTFCTSLDLLSTLLVSAGPVHFVQLPSITQ